MILFGHNATHYNVIFFFFSFLFVTSIPTAGILLVITYFIRIPTTDQPQHTVSYSSFYTRMNVNRMLLHIIVCCHFYSHEFNLHHVYSTLFRLFCKSTAVFKVYPSHWSIHNYQPFFFSTFMIFFFTALLHIFNYFWNSRSFDVLRSTHILRGYFANLSFVFMNDDFCTSIKISIHFAYTSCRYIHLQESSDRWSIVKLSFFRNTDIKIIMQ